MLTSRNTHVWQLHPTSTVNRIRIAPILAALLILIGSVAVHAQSISWVQKAKSLGSKSNGYLPRVASDGATTGLGSSTVTIYQNATNFAEFKYQTGPVLLALRLRAELGNHSQ
jgi:hypothetical protein